MLEFEEAREYLTQLADELPQDIFDRLNGGIVLIPDTRYDAHGFLTLGMYNVQPMGLGRYITIHYGSLVQAYGNESVELFKKKLKDVLYHELVHHIEHMAGDRSLEVQDEIDKARMLNARAASSSPKVILKKKEKREWYETDYNSGDKRGGSNETT